VADTGTLVHVDGHASADGDEQALVARARADPAAFAELYRRYLPRVHAFAYRRTGVVEVAEDITSAAFERALRNLGAFTWRGGGFGPWLFRIASNEIADHYRRTGRAQSLRAAGVFAELAAGEHPDPAEELDARDAVGAMLAAMDRLSPRYQRALELRYLAGLSPQEAAAAFGTSRATMAVVVHRATRALRKALATEERA
jgi:RNA polymerase sigma-70 factor (ECF subfamily)